MKTLILAVAVLIAASASRAAEVVPAVDHHQHLFSPGIAALISSPERTIEPLLAKDLIAHLDTAGIRRAVVLSTAYMYGRPDRPVENEHDKVRAENDWTAAEAARHPGRLIAFCGVNPLKSYALDELARCAKEKRGRGIKLHVGNSDIQLENAEHAAQMKRFFAAANSHRMAIVVHMRASFSKKRPYGAEQARVFLEQLLPAAPDVTVQVAHMASSGPGYDDPPGHAVMAVLADAMARGDRRTRNLWFDVTSNAGGENSPETTALLVKLIRQAGVRRVLFGSDAALAPNVPPAEAWAQLRKLPLTQAELATIAGNVAPYLR
jgi:predicted TIM-barrel fold metal-dependent hydrolase